MSRASLIFRAAIIRPELGKSLTSDLSDTQSAIKILRQLVFSCKRWNTDSLADIGHANATIDFVPFTLDPCSKTLGPKANELRLFGKFLTFIQNKKRLCQGGSCELLMTVVTKFGRFFASVVWNTRWNIGLKISCIDAWCFESFTFYVKIVKVSLGDACGDNVIKPSARTYIGWNDFRARKMRSVWKPPVT